MSVEAPPEKPTVAQPVAASPENDAAPSNYVAGIADGNLASPMRLRDYLTGVEVVFRLSKRNRAEERKALVAEAAEVEAKRIKIPVKAILKVLSPIAAAVVAWTAYEKLAAKPLPTTVAGTWATLDGKYKGRNFWINEKSLAFQNGSTTNEFSIHPIIKVVTKQVAETLFVAVDYETDGEAATLSLAYRETPSPEVRLVNQPNVRWTRQGDAPVVAQ